MFARLGSFAYRRKGTVVLGWIVGLLLLGVLSGVVGSGFSTTFGLPDGVESKRGLDLIEQHFGGNGGGDDGTIVFAVDGSVTDPTVEHGVTEYLDQVAKVDGVAGVDSPYADGNQVQIASKGAAVDSIAYATVHVPDDATQEDVKAIADEVKALKPDIPGVAFDYGGDIFQESEAPSSELLGLGFAIIILILAFGSVLATGLPIGTALAGIAVGGVSLMLLSNVINMPDFATTIGVMMGLGVGIDYALFIVSRYRENLHLGHSVEESIVIALDTSGRAVAFAGITVIISLLGMLTMGVSFVSGLGIGAAVVVFVTLMASLTLLPALIGYAGHRVEVARWRGVIAAGLVAVALLGLGLKINAFLIGIPLAIVVMVLSLVFAPLRKELEHRPPKPRRDTWAYRWSRGVQHHPWRSVTIGALALIVLSLPVLGLRLGFSDQGNDPETTTTRQAYDLLADGFGPGFNGTFLLVTELPDGADPAAVADISDAVANTEGVEHVTPARLNDPDNPTAAAWTVIPTTAPQDEATTELVQRLRDDVLPVATSASGLDVAVSGAVAIQIDFSDYLGGRLFLFFGAVLTLSFLLLLVVFRSVLVPVKAVIMNLLSIGAAYGIIVLVFQWGWLSDVIGIGGAPIEPFIPMMLFAIVFGLSMDYEVFLLSRIKEEFDRTGDAKESVADGLAATARIITVAAAIMIVVFGSFLLEPTRVIRLFGTGLAVAVLLDATIVRMLLVPATMELLGDRNWWIPRWLDRILPRVNVEGTGAHLADDVDRLTDDDIDGTPREPLNV
jgi:RND superfamily putative drug exporter